MINELLLYVSPASRELQTITRAAGVLFFSDIRTQTKLDAASP